VSANYIIDFWPYWIAGLIVFPLLAILPQLKNIRSAVEKGEREPKQVAMLFLTPGSIMLSVVAGMLTFVCFVLFLASVLVGAIAAVRAIFT